MLQSYNWSKIKDKRQDLGALLQPQLAFLKESEVKNFKTETPFLIRIRLFSYKKWLDMVRIKRQKTRPWGVAPNPTRFLERKQGKELKNGNFVSLWE